MPPVDPALAGAVERTEQAGFAGGYACALVTGTGLGLLAEQLSERVSLPYAEIPGFPRTGVTGHGGALHQGLIAGRRVLVFEGRSHAYERGDAGAMRLPIRLARSLGAQALLLTCSAGSIDPAAGPGSLVAITDHVNLSGTNPLIGETGDERFVPMTRAYDLGMRALLSQAADECGLGLREGIYAWFSGPSFETPAEIRMAARLGADVVGMSTVPEVILARHAGLPVAALALVTNFAAGVAGGDPLHAETKDVATRTAPDLCRLIRAFIARLPT